ncbi:hypothetical protein K9L97_01005 [Candidatus Woesearchaeota archaeon]|nr:hypothetical protein [Candidatus Woesearchaeota archaeon]
MRLIEYHQGCPIDTAGKLCWGPKGAYYTIFGSELRHLIGHISFSIFIGLVLLSILFTLNKKEKIHLPMYLIVLIPIIITILLFFLLAYFLPVIILY